MEIGGLLLLHLLSVFFVDTTKRNRGKYTESMELNGNEQNNKVSVLSQQAIDLIVPKENAFVYLK